MKLKNVIALGLAAAMIMANGLFVFGAETKTVSFERPTGGKGTYNFELAITNVNSQTTSEKFMTTRNEEYMGDFKLGAFYCSAPVTITYSKFIGTGDFASEKDVPIDFFRISVKEGDSWNPPSEDALIDNRKALLDEDIDFDCEIGSSVTFKKDGLYALQFGYEGLGIYVVVGGDAPTNTSSSKSTTTTPAMPSNPAPVSAPVAQSKPDVASATYTVKEGDTLAKLAKKYYGDGKQYTKIFDANKDKLKSPHLIKVGQTLVIPK